MNIVPAHVIQSPPAVSVAEARAQRVELLVLQLASWMVEAKAITDRDYAYLEQLRDEARANFPIESGHPTPDTRQGTGDHGFLVGAQVAREIVEALRGADSALDQCATVLEELRAGTTGRDLRALHVTACLAQNDVQKTLVKLGVTE